MIKLEKKFRQINGPIVIWNVRRQKLGLNGQDYITFSTPEAIMAILFYLDSHFSPNLDDPLFRTHNGMKINDNLFSYYFSKLNREWTLECLAGLFILGVIILENFLQTRWILRWEDVILIK